MAVTDFQSSFVLWDTIGMPRQPDPRPYARHQPWGNSARLQIEASLEATDEASGRVERFYLIMACRTEWMYVDRDIFARHPEHNREHRVIYTETHQRNVGRGLDAEEPHRAHPNTDTYNDLEIRVATFPDAAELESVEAVIAATRAHRPIVGRTEVRDERRGQRFVLEYPVRTMNIVPPRGRFQADTGDLIVPDFESAEPITHDRLEIGHVVYNTTDRPEFIVLRPTPLLRYGREVARVPYFSEVRAYPARNRLYAAT